MAYWLNFWDSSYRKENMLTVTGRKGNTNKARAFSTMGCLEEA